MNFNYMKESIRFHEIVELNRLNTNCISLWHALAIKLNRLYRPNEFTMTIEELKLMSGLNKNAIYAARNKLKQLGLIEFEIRSGNQCAVYRVIPQKSNKIVSHIGTQDMTQGSTQDMTQCMTQSMTQPMTIPKREKTKIKTKKESISTDVDIPKKSPYGNFSHVFLTEQEYSKLISKYKDEVSGIIQFLDDWIEMKGFYKSKSHYLAIKKWVITAFNEQKLKEKAQKLKEKELSDKENRQNNYQNGGNNYGQNEKHWSNHPSYEKGKINRSGEPWCTKYPE
ncbi:MAG: hypothetical protein CfP315_0625 [Candidatus Improbicoccus pseudotrichonymphae]|uniref:Uncharacterized protein n=1 Tax=Candidatus Improbicoccus pseudotrichonymphae TaxID=3033792 RepID=A0AA48KVL5_9FIRM|nr:MAG: hypothetical protein CfP315_0625 [Candidatus Improbicoccus pseudotrichonymphae]